MTDDRGHVIVLHSFNSLFEMLMRAIRYVQRMARAVGFNSLFEMLNALGPATNATITKQFQFSI